MVDETTHQRSPTSILSSTIWLTDHLVGHSAETRSALTGHPRLGRTNSAAASLDPPSTCLRWTLKTVRSLRVCIISCIRLLNKPYTIVVLLELIRALSIIQPHACLHAVVELADDGEHSWWHAKTSKHIPQKGLVDGVICFGEVDKAQVKGGVLLPRQFLQSSYYEHHVHRRALGSEPTLFLRQNVLAFAIATQATHDDFEEYFAGLSQEGDATIIATLSPIIVKHLNRCIFPLLRRATFPPNSDDDIVELSKSVQLSFVC